MKNRTGSKASTLAFYLVMVLAIFASVPSAQAAATRTYSLDADFDEGILVGVEHDTVHDQIQLSKKQTTLPFIWVPNSPQGTVSKVDTVAGNELGRYRVAPPGVSGSNGNPSRTTVDLKGNVWVGNREAGTVVKIGLSENGQCVDRNGDGDIDTSTDANNDGDITGGELLAWGTDECVLYEVVLIPGSEGTYVPGTYVGSYDTDYWGTAPRGLAIDNNNNLWAGTSGTKRMFYINGDTGAIVKNINVAGIGGNGAYGAVIDGDGKVWIAVLGTGVRKFDPSTDTITQVIPLGHTYGLGLDYEGYLLVGGNWQISKIKTSDGSILWTKPASANQGITATSDNNIWVASDTEHRYDKDGNWVASIPGFATSITGVAVDAAGKVWGTEYSDWIRRVDPASNTVDLNKQLIGSGSHYSYSDMTGIMARTVTTKIGTWTVDFDSEDADTPWGTISWTSNEPAETSVRVQVRSSNDKASWSAWEPATNGGMLSATPNGRYLQVETTLQSKSGEESPILYDLTVKPREIEVPVDVKPQSCRNPLNANDRGAVPAAILGTSGFDVTKVDPSTVKLEGVAPLRWTQEDVATPFEPYTGKIYPFDCTTEGADGFMDLTLKFDAKSVVSALGPVSDGEVRVLHLTGNLFDGMPIVGEDVVVILKKII